MSEKPATNPFLNTPLGVTYARNALPIIFVMSMNGLLAVMDALFLGHYVGPDALAAVTLMFPLYMLIVAFATLVASGMASLLARHLGAGDIDEARAVYAGAHGLALVAGGLLVLLFLLFGKSAAALVAGGSEELARLGLIYLNITVVFAPLVFVLSVNSDALRNEGRVGFMAAMSLLVSLANIVFNYILITQFEMGVAGSAYGTALAQALALSIIVIFRIKGATELRPSVLLHYRLTQSWGRILALGAPQSLSFIGFALGSATIIGALQMVQASNYDDTISAYGIITRVMTFVFLPLLGLSHAMQTITGHNYGAGLWRRSNDSLKFAVIAAFIYCSLVQVIFTLFAVQIGRLFVDNTAVVNEVGRILPIIATGLCISGPLMMIGTYFQAIGNATRAAILGLSKPYFFAIPLTFGLTAVFGEVGIWMASPISEVLLLCLTALMLSRSAALGTLRWGLFQTGPDHPK